MEPIFFWQTIKDYIESIHSSNGFSRERMQPEKARTFDEAVQTLVWSHVGEEWFETAVATHITWGYPQKGA